MSQGPQDPAGHTSRRRVRRRVRVDESGRPVGPWGRWWSRRRSPVLRYLLFAAVFVAGLAAIWLALGKLVRDPPLSTDVPPVSR